MSKYHLEAKYLVSENLHKLDNLMRGKLWQLYCNICEFWQTTDDPSFMRSDLFVFISNRIESNTKYMAEYANYIEVIDELIEESGDKQAYVKLFTDPLGNITPPVSKLARAKQFVVNEFISLNLALGGFKTFGNPNVADGILLNYPGFIGGMNRPDHTPYRTKKK